MIIIPVLLCFTIKSPSTMLREAAADVPLRVLNLSDDRVWQVDFGDD